MIRQRVSFVVAGAIVATTALTAGLATSASAADTIYDPATAPASGDLVGVGSDTIEIALDYLTKGHNGVAGFNAGGASFDVHSWAAAGDPANVTLRSGGTAIPRSTINGSGAGKSKLYSTGNNTDVNFARSSSTLSAAEISANLQQFPFAVDGLKLGVSAIATNAPATITPAQLVQIYSGAVTNWNQIGGASGVIKPYIPQAGSGTLSFFTAQLTAANGGSPVNLAGSVGSAQEHDDTLIKNDPNAIVPFSTARAKALTSTIKLEKGFKAYRAVYNVVRNADLAGSLGTKINAFFGEDGFVCSPAAKPLIEAAGFDQLATSEAGGVCGVPTQAAVSTFVTTSQVDTDTTLVAESVNNNKVKLTATVDASSDPIGSVTFSEDGKTIGSPVEVDGGVATTTLSLVPNGDHRYTASFVPEDSLAFTSSSSDAVTASVKTPSNVSVGVLNPTGTYGTTRTVAVAATVDGEAATGNVSLTLDNGSAKSVALIGGVGFYTVPGTSAVGSHTLTATLAGTSTRSGDVASTKLTVTKASTKASFTFADPTIKASATPKANVKVSITGASSSIKPNGKITLTYGSKKVGTATVTNGVAKVNLSKFKKRSSAYSIKATFTSTSANYASSPASAGVKLTVS